jgi:uncharacterized protein
MPLPHDVLELLRAQSGLSIDEEGRFLHRGEPITHARTLAVLWSSLERVPDGRWLVRIGRESAYVAVEDGPWVVRAVLDDGPGTPPRLRLSDGSEEPLDPATLRVGSDGVLRCAVRGGVAARFARAAHLQLGMALEEHPPGSSELHLTVGGTRWPIRRGPSSGERDDDAGPERPG